MLGASRKRSSSAGAWLRTERRSEKAKSMTVRLTGSSASLRSNADVWRSQGLRSPVSGSTRMGTTRSGDTASSTAAARRSKSWAMVLDSVAVLEKRKRVMRPSLACWSSTGERSRRPRLRSSMRSPTTVSATVGCSQEVSAGGKPSCSPSSATNMSWTLPRTTSSREARACSSMRLPLTRVPLRLSRSVRVQRSPLRSTRAWRRETLPPAMWTPQDRSRPMTIGSSDSS